MKKVVLLVLALLGLITSCKIESDYVVGPYKVVDVEKIEKALTEKLNPEYFIINENKISIDFNYYFFFKNSANDAVFTTVNDFTLNGNLYNAQYLGENRYKLSYKITDSNIVFDYNDIIPVTIKDGDFFITFEFDGDNIKLINAELSIYHVYNEDDPNRDYKSGYPWMFEGIYYGDFEVFATERDFYN